MPALAMRVSPNRALSPLLPPGLPPFRSHLNQVRPAIATLFERFETTLKSTTPSPNGTFLKTPGLVSSHVPRRYARFRPATPSAHRCPRRQVADIRVELEPRIVEIVA